MSGTRLNLSLKGTKARGGYTPKYTRGKNFPTNTFDAMFYEYPAQGDPSDYDFVQGDNIEALIFVQDAPIWTELRSYYSSFTDPAVPTEVNHLEKSPYVLNHFTIGQGPLVQDPDYPAQLQQMKGETPTHDLAVNGYGIQRIIANLGILKVLASARPTCSLKVITQAPQCYGPQNAVCFGSNLGQITQYRPIILHEQDYTAAIQNDGNTFSWGTDPDIVVYVICGIFTVIAG